MQLRLFTGLVLFTFAFTHLLNHALGLVSPEAMEAFRALRTAVTRSLPGTVLLFGSALVHLVLGVSRVLQRHTLRMPAREAVQIVSGLLIPLLLMSHVLGTRGAHTLYGIDDDYHHVLAALWPERAWRQTVLVLLVWVHGCIGLHHWLRFRFEAWYSRAFWALYTVAVCVPVLALAGFVSGGRAVALAGRPAVHLDPEQALTLATANGLAPWAYLAVLLALLLHRFGRSALDRLRRQVHVSYVGGPTVIAPPGFTLLEVSRRYGIPHTSVCGGRARCSTCRVRVLDGLDHLPPPSHTEQQVLTRVGASPNVRLACQTVPEADVSIALLLPAHAPRRADAGGDGRYVWGVEQSVTIVFIDIRGFTALSEARLPYDVVFVLNQYLVPMSEVIEEHGGYVDKFMGDGILAIFGIDHPPAAGARDALAAARGMGGVLQALNAALHDELARPLDIGIGIHTGPAVLGHVGTTEGEAAQRITALGDTVNTASRLESACKELDVQVVVSLATVMAAGFEPCAASAPRAIHLRGKTQPLDVLSFARAIDIPAAQPAAAAPPPPTAGAVPAG